MPKDLSGSLSGFLVPANLLLGLWNLVYDLLEVINALCNDEHVVMNMAKVLRMSGEVRFSQTNSQQSYPARISHRTKP